MTTEQKTSTTTPEAPRGRWVYFIAAEDFVEGSGFMVSTVHENESGRRLTGDWPYNGKAGERLPYFWGKTFREAEEIAKKKNLERGISIQDQILIVLASMNLSGI